MFRPSSRVLGLFIATVVIIAGCGQTPLGGSLLGPPDGSTGTAGARAPSFQFDSPTDSTTVRDDSKLSIRYTVGVDRPVSVSLAIDTDGDATNGNEFNIVSNRAVDAPGGSDSVEFVAGRFPYGKYFIRAKVSDGTQDYTFNALGSLNVVPLINNVNADNAEALDSLSDFGGMRLLYTTGSPGPVNSRVPFVATWSYPDFLDHLSPVFIAPFEINTKMELRRLQFYAFGHTEAQLKHAAIYRGTDANTPGALIRQVDVRLASFATGGWSIVKLDPPLVLDPGKYGISFHGDLEFTENWAGNAAKGANFAWVSPFSGEAFRSVTEADLGFAPNFTYRLIGHLVPESTALSPNGRLIIPTPLEPVYPDNGSKPPEGLGNKTEDVDAIGGASPFHVAWQRAR